jgi:tetratricopeptide (TPR) repeat protein
MADGARSIKLRCASWQQLATIYRRDLSHGAMFLKATTPPAIGTPVRIDLALPSATVIVLTGVVHGHIRDPQRGPGVELRLAPIPAASVWLIESALASEHERRMAPVHGTPALGAPHKAGHIPAISDSADVSAAEQDLIKALVLEAEALKKLDPFLVLGIGYEATDPEVRSAFGELTKRYHPDRFARYESLELRYAAEEIFLLIRDAYRRLADAGARAQLLQSLGMSAPAPRGVPGPRHPSGPFGDGPLRATPSAAPPRIQRAPVAVPAPAAPMARPMISAPLDASPLEDLIDQGRLDDALAAYKEMGRKHPHDRPLRAGALLCEGLRALAAHDRLGAARWFEAALEIDPSNERAARALADMRRRATRERKGLLSRLMGKKEP